MKALKWEFVSFHFIKKTFLLFPFLFFSCGDSLKNLNDQKSIKDIYNELKNKAAVYPHDRVEAAVLHNQFLKVCQDNDMFKDFISTKVERKDRVFCTDLRRFVLSSFNPRECSYSPEVADEVKDVHQICLVPGFFIRTVDAYTPRVAKYIKLCLVEKDPNCAVETSIVPRWGAYVKEYSDNTDFKTQCEALNRQLTDIIANLKKKYKNAKIHLTFIGESYGGKITLFFLDKFLADINSERIAVDNFITVHSPLYGMVLAKYMVKNREQMMNLWTNPAFSLLISAIQYDFLDVFNTDYYFETFNLLSVDSIEGVNTNKALDYLIKEKIKILNFIGTPNKVVFGGLKPSYKDILLVLDKLKSYFFDANGNKKKDKWDNLDHFLDSVCDIFLDLKSSGLFEFIIDNFGGQVKQTLSNSEGQSSGNQTKQILRIIYNCEDKTKIKATLNELLAQFNIDEKLFIDTQFPQALDMLAELLNDVHYIFSTEVFNSDLVVGVSEITNNQEVIDMVKDHREESFIFDKDPNLVYISSPHIFHACEHNELFMFDRDLERFFIPYFKGVLEERS